MDTRSAQVARVLGRRALAAAAASRLGFASGVTRRRAVAGQARLACEELGPAFVKIGQLVSVRPDVFPPELCFELEGLQDTVAPLPYADVAEVIREEFGRDPSDLFATFDPEPTASASIAQVHRATLREESRPVWGQVMPPGSPVAVKVVRPGIERDVVADLASARRLVRSLSRFGAVRRWNIDGLVEELATSLHRELDLRNEARVSDRFAFDFRDDLQVFIPRVVWSRTTQRVLTMEFVDGWRLSALDDAVRGGVDAYGLAVHGARVFMRQVLIHGRFHADLHPANLLVTRDNRIAYLDFGIVGTLTSQERYAVAQVLAALVFRDPERALRYSAELGVKVPAAKLAALGDGLARLMDGTLTAGPPDAAEEPADCGGGHAGGRRQGRVDVKDFGIGFLSLLGRHGIEIPVGYGLLVKSLVTVEGVARALYPDIDIIETARPFVTRLLLERGGRAGDVPERLGPAVRAALRELVS